MSIDREDYFCDNCQTQIVFDLTINEEISVEDIKHCPVCGSKYDSDMDLGELGFGDPADYDE